MVQIARMFPVIHAAGRFTLNPVERRATGEAQHARHQK
jgi:hypothetical protein